MSLMPFDYEGQPVRAVELDGEWLVGTDVARALGYANPSDALTRVHPDDKREATLALSEGSRIVSRERTLINESGVYFLVLGSTLATARAFQRWITAEVLPQIRKTGRYSTEAAEHQVNAQIFQSRARIELLQAAKGLVHPDHLEAHARTVLARGLGEGAVLDPATRPLYTQDYLGEKNLGQTRLRSVAGVFGKRVKAAYVAQHGRPPQRYPLSLGNGQVREVNAYTEADRPLLDQVWATYYEEKSA